MHRFKMQLGGEKSPMEILVTKTRYTSGVMLVLNALAMATIGRQ